MKKVSVPNEGQNSLIVYLTLGVSVLYLFVANGFLLFKLDAFLLGMEIFTILAAPMILVLIISLVADSASDRAVWKHAAISFASCTMVLTVVAHFINLTVTEALISDGIAVPGYLRIGTWPSVEMAIDYLAWGFFLGLAFWATAMALSGDEKKGIKASFMVCGSLCLIGMLGPII